MSDREPMRLEPTEGERLPPAAGERVVVGLAALALVAGVLIALGNVVEFEMPALAGSSATPAASIAGTERPRPTRSPRPLREFWLQPGTPQPEPGMGEYPFWGWIRSQATLVIRTRADAGAPEVGVLPAGELALAEEFTDSPGTEGGWLHVVAPEPQGWIATTTAEGSELVERFVPPVVPVSGDIWGVAAGDEGFVAYGWSPGTSDLSYPGLVAASSNGISWDRADASAAALRDQWTVAWGPAGWLTITAVFNGPVGPTHWVWQSADGLHWSALGAMEDLPQTMYPARLVGSSSGYLLVSGAGTVTLWSSTDGVTWREAPDVGLNAIDWISLAAGPGGFYAWDQRPIDPWTRDRSAFSADGETWSSVTYGPEGPTSHVVAHSQGWLGMDADPATGSPRAWIGAVDGQRLSWRVDRKAYAGFAGAAVSALASDGQRAVALGWDRETEQPLVWTLDAGAWTRSALPAAFDGIPRLAAAGPAGVVAVGYRSTMRGLNPIFWHLTDDGSWAPESSPLMAVAPDPRTDDCGPPAPADALDLALLDRPSAVVCFGDIPMTVRAYSAGCIGCYGPISETRQPAWLAEPGANQLYLSPIEDNDAWSTAVTLDPSLPYDPAWARTWVEVTGHFDDPASQTCRWIPSPEEERWYAGRQQVIDGCRQQFVVTAVTVVEGE